jgi:tRNA (mo5U34)-methyltransferase
MRNVHALPTLDTLIGWIRSAGYTGVEHIDTTLTTVEEQRSTPWMTFHSLRNFLDPDNPMKTVEGHPAPRRTVITARRP